MGASRSFREASSGRPPSGSAAAPLVAVCALHTECLHVRTSAVRSMHPICWGFSCCVHVTPSGLWLIDDCLYILWNHPNSIRAPTGTQPELFGAAAQPLPRAPPLVATRDAVESQLCPTKRFALPQHTSRDPYLLRTQWLGITVVFAKV